MSHQWVDIAGARIGLRWNLPEPGNLLTGIESRLFDGPAPPNLSIAVGGTEGPITKKHELYVQGRLILISRNSERLRRAVLRSVSDLAAIQPPATVMLRAACLIAPEGQLTLVDHRLQQGLWRLERRLIQKGYRILDTPKVAVDIETGSAVLTRPLDLFDQSKLPEWSTHPNQSDWLDNLDGGSLPITRVVFEGTAQSNRLSESLAEVGPMTQQDDRQIRVADIERVLKLMQQVHFDGALLGEDGGLANAVGLIQS